MAAEGRNLCVVLKAVGDLQLEERAIPHPGKGEVLIAMRSVGICGSDVHYWVAGRIGDFIVKAPMVMGHEASGRVAIVGEGVTHLQVGDRVAIEPGVPCRMCSFCKEGRYNLCRDMRFCATPPVDGSLARYYTHAADFCYKLPDHVSFDEGALLEPLSVGVHACQRAGVKLGSKVLVCGAGPIGLVCLLTAKACGASEVIITDLDEDRLQVARTMGATHILRVTTRDSRALARQIVDILGSPPDQSIECSGAEPSIATAIYATRSGGVLVLVGLGAPEAKLPIVDASMKEIDIRGIFRYCNCYPTALELVASGRVDVKPLITHTYKLEEMLQAFERAKTGEGGTIKVPWERDDFVRSLNNKDFNEERAIPHPGKGGENSSAVLIAMRSVGICGSDVHYWVAGRIGDFIVKAPMVMGHEASGRVAIMGEGVTHLQVGDRVAIEPGVPCRMCPFCKEGRYNLCHDMRFCATPPVDGSLARYYTHAADFCYKLPDHVSFDEGALLEPLSVGVHACQRAGVKLGSKVLVCGAGPIGLVCLLTAKACGASEVIITDLDEDRLQVAKKMGATHILRVTTRDSRALARQIVDILGSPPDQSIECSGAEPSIATAIYATRSGGVLVLVGLGAPEAKLPIVDASMKEVDIRGIFRYCNCYPTALELVASGRVDVKPLITHTYKLEEMLQAFERAKTREGGTIKVMIRCGTDEQ